MLINRVLIHRGFSKCINKNNINRYLSNITSSNITNADFRDSVIHNRDKYLSPSLATFQAYDDPLVLTRGKMQYVWDSDDKKYIDLLAYKSMRMLYAGIKSVQYNNQFIKI